MRTLPKCVSGVCVGVMSLALSSALAQTVANGPYYATPSWDQTLPAATRFIVLSNFANAAVLDRETGLVWERAPSTSSVNGTWFNSLDACAFLNLGGRRGWRLPSVHELSSLIDTTVAASPPLPTGHPFTLAVGKYWTASRRVTTVAWAVDMADGSASFGNPLSAEYLHWCVRGGQNHARDY